MRNVHQLWNSKILVSGDANIATHELDSIYVVMLLDEIIDVAVIHPFRDQSEPQCLLIERCGEQR